MAEMGDVIITPQPGEIVLDGGSIRVEGGKMYFKISDVDQASISDAGLVLARDTFGDAPGGVV